MTLIYWIKGLMYQIGTGSYSWDQNRPVRGMAAAAIFTGLLMLFAAFGIFGSTVKSKFYD